MIASENVSKNLASITRARAVNMVAAVAGGILLCAIAQAADAAAIKTPVGAAPGTTTEAPPVQTDFGSSRSGSYYGGYGGYRGSGGYRRRGSY
jgi:hypothetical protein